MNLPADQTPASTPAFPPWLRRPWPSGDDFGYTKHTLAQLRLHTVCQSARCPNLAECWSRRTATVMVLGNTCSRNCAFCSVPSGRPDTVDPDEPAHVAEAVAAMGLKHAVITTVVRDDLPDGGAAHIAATVAAIRERNPETTIEVLVSDYRGDRESVLPILDAAPEVFGHNIETVHRLHPRVRDRRFTYEHSLAALRLARDHSRRTIVKSAFMLGLSETAEEVAQTLQDLRAAGCDAVCIGQYLRPTAKQAPVAEYVHPDRFKEYEALAYDMGFGYAVAGPFVRSSYRSEAVLEADFARERLNSPQSSQRTRSIDQSL
ncbi:MAG: lipoyl synthase [Candidatus Hydrogenedentales bacterium]